MAKESSLAPAFNLSDPRLRSVLKRGGVVVIPTDTIYGIVGLALRPAVVRRIYRLRRRNPKKPFIILIGSLRDLAEFGVKTDTRQKKILRRVWPGKVSVILPCAEKKFAYLHRGTNALAFRLPRPAALRALIKKTGPLVAPSANPEGAAPARTIREAKAFFGGRMDFYADGGRIAGKPSTLVDMRDGVKILRRGAERVAAENDPE